MEFWKVSSLQDKCQPDPKCAFSTRGNQRERDMKPKWEHEKNSFSFG